MEVTSIQDGIIIDHVPAGTALKVLDYLSINPASTKLALIMNTDSHRYGTKDIIKIEAGGALGHGGCDPWRPDRRQDDPHAARTRRQRDHLRQPALCHDHGARHRSGVLPRPYGWRSVPLPVLR